MQAERVLCGIAVICAVLLLFAPLTPRTSWTHTGGGGMRHSAGWDWVAPASGVIALVGLGVGALSRPGVVVPVLGAAVASLALGSAAAAALGHWVTLVSGAMDLGQSTLHPAPAVEYFGGIASVGTVASLVLLGTWLRPGEYESWTTG